MNLPTIDTLNISGKRALLRGDTDVEAENVLRLQVLAETVREILEKNAAKIIILGSRGRPEGEDPELSLEPIAVMLTKLLGEAVAFVPEVTPTELPDSRICLLENLRFEKGEEANDEEFAKKLASLGEIYINEAFGVSHREHASIVGLPKLLPHAGGLRLVKEAENLSKIFNEPKRPVAILLSGKKEDKLKYVKPFKQFADRILIAGRLPDVIEKLEIDNIPESIEILTDLNDEKVTVARLLPDKDDITINSIEAFEQEITQFGTIVVGGPIGKFEEEGHRQGTERVFRAASNSSAFKVAGGGDTEAALKLFGLTDKFDWVSVGGGAMLEFLAYKTLPGLEALST